jgi:hypothetical protein
VEHCKFALRQDSLRYAAENTAVFCLDPQILQAYGKNARR